MPIVLFLVTLIIAAGLVSLRIPPRSARLLPECDAIAYANLRLIRLGTHLEEKPVAHSAEYQQFINGSGVVLERDLNTVAFALTKMTDPAGPNGPVAFSEVFTGRFDRGRLTTYLATVATVREQYAGQEIFTMPVTLPEGPAAHVEPTGRTLRVAIFDNETVVASNAPTTEQIHAMLDHRRGGGGPFAGPALLSGLYGEIPYLSSVWGIGALGLPFAEAGRVSAFGMHLPFPDTTPFIASLRYTTALGLRIEQIAPSDAEAGRSVQKLNGLLSILRQMLQVQSLGPNEPYIRKLTDSLKVEQRGDRAVVSAKIPTELLHGLMTSPTVLSQDAVPSTPHPASK